MGVNWKKPAILVIILTLGYMPFIYGAVGWWPHNHWIRILSGPIAIIASAALAGASAARFSKWWLLTLIAPLAGIMLLVTESV